MKHSELIQRFINDLQIQDCIVQAGTAQKVTNRLTPANLDKCLMNLRGLDAFFLAGVRAGTDGRAADRDVIYKNSFFIDFDIREYWKKEHGEDISDNDLKEVGTGIIESLNTNKALSHWRYMVFSGNGIHVHYFGEPVSVDSPEKWKLGMNVLLKRVEDLVKLRPDYNCTNAGRMARLPGSENCKHGRRVLVEILDYQEGAAFDIDLIKKAGEVVMKQANNKSSESVSANGIPEGKRNTTLASLAGALRHHGIGEEVIAGAVMSINSKACKPPLPDNEVLQIAKSISQYPPGKVHSSEIAVSVPVLIRLDEVNREEVQWLWKDRIPMGKLTIMEGDPGTGKSWCSQAIASAVTRGLPLPGDASVHDPANALFLTAEDGIGDTIRPRMEDMGADLPRVIILKSVRDREGKERHFSLTDDLAAVEEALVLSKCKLVIIDPLNAYLGGEIDTNRDAAIRAVLTPLTQLAEKYGVALLCIRHLTKSPKDKAIYRGQGSIGFTAAARVVHLVGKHPEQEAQRVIACTKNNLAAPPPAYAYEIVQGQFVWRGEVTVTANELLAPEEGGEEQTALEEAKDFLQSALSGKERRAEEITKEARAAGIAERTLKRAKRTLDVKTRRDGFGSEGFWIWALPDNTKEAKKPTVEQLALLGQKEVQGGTIGNESEQHTSPLPK